MAAQCSAGCRRLGDLFSFHTKRDMDAAELQRPPPGELFLDHVSHFVRDLDAAAGLLEQLGFVVTAGSIQEVAGSRGGANRRRMRERGYIQSPTAALQPEPG